MSLVSSINVKKIKMKTADQNYYLAVYGSYQELMVGLFNGPQLIEQRYVPNARLSAVLIPVIDELLKRAGVRLTHLAYIAVVNGPGSFSSLRALLATVNGIAAGSGVPLVGCDGLAVFVGVAAAAVRSKHRCLLLVVMNAYNNEHFYRLVSVDSFGTSTVIQAPVYRSIEAITELVMEHSAPLYVVGNSALLFTDCVHELGGEVLTATPVDVLNVMALMAGDAYRNGGAVSALQPIHLKEMHFKKLV